MSDMKFNDAAKAVKTLAHSWRALKVIGEALEDASQIEIRANDAERIVAKCKAEVAEWTEKAQAAKASAVAKISDCQAEAAQAQDDLKAAKAELAVFVNGVADKKAAADYEYKVVADKLAAIKAEAAKLLGAAYT